LRKMVPSTSKETIDREEKGDATTSFGLFEIRCIRVS
jgi:hypothetical protein